MEDSTKRKREMETKLIEKVSEVISAIKSAKHVDEVVCALHSLALLLFPLDSSLLSGSVDQRYKEQVLSAKVPSEEKRREWWQAFYQGAAFPTLARFLLLDLASNWLACFPLSARIHVYDVFFVDGLATEVVQTLVPCLRQNATDDHDVNSVHSNTERLLVLCLLENDGVLHMAREFWQSKNSLSERLTPVVSRVAQIIASIPDKARLGAPTSLSSHSFFKQITIQLLSVAEEKDEKLFDNGTLCNRSDMGDALLFVGETFSRICRRGSSDVISSEITPQVLRHVRSLLSSNIDSSVADVFESDPGSRFWLKMIEAIKDPYAVERLSEQLLHYLAIEHASDVEAYWFFWLLFHQTFKNQTSVRSMFVDKFLHWKIFPICCLRWILQFSVLECPPDATSLTKGHNIRGLLDTVQRLLAVWSKKEYVQSAPMEQQTYLSAAVGLCLEKMSKKDLDETKDVMHLILQGVSCRLESPNNLVRKMASSVALAFSKVIDPENPLYLDDSCTGDIIDWEFGMPTPEKRNLDTSNCKQKDGHESKTSSSAQEKDFKYTAKNVISNNLKRKNKKLSEFKFVDPDEIIDPATLNNESVSDKDDDDNASENSDSSSDSSLQPYDLSDDDTDLKKKISQLVDVVAALRKSDDADGVERALDVAEKLVRASPDELSHLAGDLARTLVQVRCSDLAVEGEEDSAEDKRQRALVALLVTCPLESLDTLNKLLYSPNVDVSQRIMILDVMTDAAQELANSKTIKPKHQTGPLISSISESQPWFLPSSRGPAGVSSWKEISETETLLNWSTRYERELPSKPGQIRRGKTRRWSLRSSNIQETQIEWSHNKFPVYAAAFMLPAMQGFDKKRHGVDLLGRDFIVLGKLIHMLGVCMKCASMHPEASSLAPLLLDLLRSREVCHHKEAYVRRAVLFAASCILVALHPSNVASSLVEGNLELSIGLEWVRTYALQVIESDTDRECYTMAMTCLQLHSEMALQATRALESAETTFKAKGVGLPSNLSKGTIKIPHSIVEF
ncbi:telomere length regulation protein TEL2 homolog [Quercus lobata]|uniref:Telomere length regulation protein conserved domain-containing protein n=1 Tax=Quercus lobata TaxID=97700 RepID=A0A7N2MQ98_QUELO|nr:telomere length regulation protein TEL2 homolog [Quercus lobata]